MKGLGNLGNIANMMKQAQQMQKQMADIQAELETMEVSASAGGGMVSVTINGKHKMTKIKIEPDVVNADDTAMLEDLILIAVNEAHDRAQEMAKERMASLTGGLDIPGITS